MHYLILHIEQYADSYKPYICLFAMNNLLRFDFSLKKISKTQKFQKHKQLFLKILT